MHDGIFFDICSFNDFQVHYDDIANNQKSFYRADELLCLFNFLRKNTDFKAVEKLCQFPYTVLKRESPDFKIVFPNDDNLLIEITAITTRKLQAALVKAEKSEDTCFIELDDSILESDKPEKWDHDKYLRMSGEEFMLDGTYGNKTEKQWADLVMELISNKAKKTYAKEVNILLLDDRYFPYRSEQYLRKRLECLREEIISIEPLNDMDVYPTVVTDSCKSIGVLRKDWRWEYSLIHENNVVTYDI